MYTLTTDAPGFFGKLPWQADFVYRRVPESFITFWDRWLQAGFDSSQRKLGKPRWRDLFLASQCLHFGLSTGIHGSTAWAGILLPTRDQVNRIYPLILAIPLEGDISLLTLLDRHPDWFNRLESLALDFLRKTACLDDFDQALRQFSLHIDSLQQDGFRQPVWGVLSSLLLQSHASGYSIWGMRARPGDPVSFYLFEGMPQSSLFPGLFSGQLELVNSVPPSRSSSLRESGDSAEPERAGWWLRIRNWLMGSPPAGHSVGDLANPGDSDQIMSATDPDADATIPGYLPLRHSSGCTHPGHIRTINQDAILERPEAGLWVVADGMGGHERGELASQRIVEQLRAVPVEPSLEVMIKRVQEALQDVNQALIDLRQEPNEPVGSTVVALIMIGRQCGVLWAGDSRLYRYRQGYLEQITRDHSLESGSGESPDQHTNIITRAVGASARLQLDILTFESARDDVFLLCSDGLIKELTATEIAVHLLGTSCHAGASALMKAALAKSARDNISVIVVGRDSVGDV